MSDITRHITFVSVTLETFICFPIHLCTYTLQTEYISPIFGQAKLKLVDSRIGQIGNWMDLIHLYLSFIFSLSLLKDENLGNNDVHFGILFRFIPFHLCILFFNTNLARHCTLTVKGA